MEEDIEAGDDRGETLGSMAPLLIGENSRHRTSLVDLVVDLSARAAGFRRSLPDGIRTALADLVRSMNCYYSNLIEGHDTHPVDIERALRNEYSDDVHKRNLQLEARAHIAVQRWLDGGGLAGQVATVAGIREIHRRFTELLPEELLWSEDPQSGQRIRVMPGEFRTRDVQVGRHIPASPGAIPRLLAGFEKAYRGLGRTDIVLGAAAAHHRLLWIHPFLDGNGRVARLMSHAMLLDAMESGGVWSVARGLARNVSTYKAHLANCDLQRRNDMDGRGNLSEEALAGFTRFFLETCIDQVDFMERLVQPDRLITRIRLWMEEEVRTGTLFPKTGQVLETVLYRGTLPRGEVSEILGVTPRHARRLVSPLIELGVLIADGAREPLRIGFPSSLAYRWMPGLFPEAPDCAHDLD